MIGLKELIGFEVRTEGGPAERISDFLIDERNWTVGYAVTPAGGMISGERRYVAVDGLRFDGEDRALTSPNNRFELGAAAPRDVVSKVEEGWAALRQGSSSLAAAPDPPKLHSPWQTLKTMLGADIAASDGVYGSLDDLLLEPGQWRVQYFVGRSYAWKKKPSVLIPAAWVKQVSWQGETVEVSVSREALEREPSYKPASHAQTQ